GDDGRPFGRRPRLDQRQLFGSGLAAVALDPGRHQLLGGALAARVEVEPGVLAAVARDWWPAPRRWARRARRGGAGRARAGALGWAVGLLLGGGLAAPVVAERGVLAAGVLGPAGTSSSVVGSPIASRRIRACSRPPPSTLASASSSPSCS